jgi:16S rRNA (guanine966-N2)-methyltransferase
MLRIITGTHRGRSLEIPLNKEVRPTSGRVREAAFNILSHGVFRDHDHTILENARVADLFCGSGALGFEALSRGANHVTFTDKNSDNLEVARRNAAMLGETKKCKFIRCDSSEPPTEQTAFDILFLDPPYKSGMLELSISNLITRGWSRTNSIFVIECSKHESINPHENLSLHSQRIYGNTQLLLLIQQ